MMDPRRFPARPPRTVHGFTLAEMMVSMGASVIILGGLMMGAIGMQKCLVGSQRYAEHYSDQRRLIDFMARDLRRAIAVSTADGAGLQRPFTEGTVQVFGDTALILSLPGYYRSHVKNTADFDQPLEVVGTEDRLDYGSADGLASPVEVTFRKAFVPQEGCTCYVRREGGADEVIVRAAERLFAEVTISSKAQNAALKVWFSSPFSKGAPLVTTYDALLLRNPPLDLRP